MPCMDNNNLFCIFLGIREKIFLSFYIFFPTINYAFEIPISIKARQGVILLFDHQDQNFNFFHNTVADIETIKLDNDL